MRPVSPGPDILAAPRIAEASLPDRQRARLAAAFRAAENKGVRFAVLGRLTALAVLALWQALSSGGPDLYYVEAVIALFAALGLLQLAVTRLSNRWRPLLYLLVFADAALLACVLALPNPLQRETPPPTLTYHFPQFSYFYLLPVFSLLSFSPLLVLWAGASGCICWSIGLARAVSAPGALTVLDYKAPQPAPMADAIAFVADPMFVDVQARIEEMLVLMIVSGLLALAVRRMRMMVRDQALAERARANLARYFSPNIVDELAAMDRPFAEVRTQDVAVLFADIVGFTRLSEGVAPAEAIALLRAFHRRTEQTVYEFGGTLDKFLGDGVMATFGTPRPGARDAADALACACALLARIDAWNRERAGRGLAAIRIGIGVHCGPVVLGDVGSDRHIEFAVIGDAVNVASRLESLTRELDVDIVISDRLAVLAAEQGGDAALAGFSAPQPKSLRGRDGPILVLTFRDPRRAAA